MLARRRVLKGMVRMPLAGASLAAVLADPALARAAGAALEEQQLRLASGRVVRAFLARPARLPAPAVMLVHEWWGLNDQIKAVTAEFAREGYLALAIDLMRGQVATTRAAAARQMRAVDPREATETSALWLRWLARHAAATGRIGTVGWCFGGGWSLNASIAVPVDATVVYYGRVDRDVEDLRRLKGPVLGHFATRDKWITREMVARFEAAMREAGKRFTTYWYEADHAFANPTGARYDAEDAKLAWSRTLAFFAENLT